MKSKTRFVIQNSLLATALAALTACSASFTSSPYYDLDPMKPQKGVTYKLPRTVVDYAVSYTLYKTTLDEDNVSYEVLLEKAPNSAESPITLTPKNIGDDRAVFLINTEDLAAFSVHTKDAKFSLSAEGVLTAANGEFDDKSTEIVEKFTSAGLKVAKLVVNPSGAGRVDGDGDKPKTEHVMTVVVKGQINYAQLQEKYAKASLLTYQVPTDYVRGQMKKKIVGDKSFTIPSVSIVFAPETTYSKLTAAAAADALKAPRVLRHSKKFKGLWVRQPASVPFAVNVDDNSMMQDRILIADAGPTTLVPLKSRIATDRNTKLTFHAGTGSISEHSFVTTSQGLKIATSADTLADTVTTQVTGIMAARQSKSDAENSLETLIITEERKIQDSRTEIDSYKALDKKLEEDYERLGNETDPAKQAANKAQRESIAAERKILTQNTQLSKRKAEDAQRQIDYLETKLGRL